MSSQAKAINLLLHNGNLNGVISVEDSSWNSGALFYAPRESVKELLQTDACDKYGVYLLLSSQKVYVGQSSDLEKRLNQHLKGKDWWESVVILTTKDDSLNHADIDYLESALIEKASSLHALDCENKNKGNQPKVDKFRKVFLSQYLEEALFLMELIGVTVFSKDKAKRMVSLNVEAKDIATRLSIGKGMKSDAIAYLAENGVEIEKSPSYSALQSDGKRFWINPQTKLLNQEWQIILNDTTSRELLVLCVPKNTASINPSDPKRLAVRADKSTLLDLSLSRESLVDEKSGFDFMPYLKIKVPY